MDRPIELTAESLWNEVAGRLKGALNETTYRTWFAEAEGAELSDDAFVLGVPNDFTREWIEGHFLGLIGAAVRDVTGQERRVALSVTERLPAATPAPAEAPKGRSRPPPLKLIPIFRDISATDRSAGSNEFLMHESQKRRARGRPPTRFMLRSAWASRYTCI